MCLREIYVKGRSFLVNCECSVCKVQDVPEEELDEMPLHIKLTLIANTRVVASETNLLHNGTLPDTRAQTFASTLIIMQIIQKNRYSRYN